MDYNDDGMLDIVVGDRNGYTHYYRRTSESPITLTKEADLVCGGVTIDVGYNSAPVCVDWDEDGNRDLLLGTQDGTVRLYINDTIDTDPVYNSYSLLQSSGTNISHYRNCPQVFDMNMDGRKDLLCGANDYSIYYYENTGTNANPAFSGNEAIINTGYYGARFCIDDWNEDGLPDVLASNYNGFVQVYIQTYNGVSGEGGTSTARSLAADRNPFNSTVVISSSGFESGTMILYDMSGRVMMEQPLTGSMTIDGSGLACGCYLVVASDENGSETLKLLKI
ncbi:MAG: hypothetical protein AVO35_06580 [Candidatus Aegiribacteria sp. MLS_C]|nr:MAG: hypothetical protein AVO35_06580 [Candidatus Aegiribacteria sp. MLS_C]